MVQRGMLLDKLTETIISNLSRKSPSAILQNIHGIIKQLVFFKGCY